MNGTAVRWFAFLESNTTGTGREFCARARARGLRPVLLTRDAARYPYVTEDAVDTLENVEIAVLDEADQMSDLGFLPEVTELLDQV
ncbi:hypothetical protein ACWDVV_23645, partial [Streptomyces tendae]